MRPFVAFASSVVFFHVSEFLLAGIFMRKDLSKRCIVTGEVVRKTAMITARHNFTHDVKFEREEQHVLVTNGIYGFCRHPGYVGWFVWVLGTQLVLANPVCTLAFTAVAWKFFSERIPVEERQLQRFFGRPYTEYKARTPTLIPFIP